MTDTSAFEAQSDPIGRAMIRFANRCCPDCGTAQPIYVSSRPKGIGYIRRGRDVVPCPGCGVALRLEDVQVDPHGILTSLIVVTLMTGGFLVLIPIAARAGWGNLQFGLAIVVAVVALMPLLLGLSLLRLRSRQVSRAVPDPAAPKNATETRP